MIPLLIVAHGNLGDSLIQCASHVLGQRPEQLESLDLSSSDEPGEMLERARAQIARLDRGKGVLILTDVYGATPCNTVCKLIQHEHVEAVAGVNLPMLLKALNYRNETLALLIRKAVQGGQGGVMYILPRDAEEEYSDA
ncbi:MAG: PTS fructose transporter subunit IIA [Gammaproteobacteria bacterium]|nr:PTS fructose transporter subunit IIA [Gammaproteobacteria bacterium]